MKMKEMWTKVKAKVTKFMDENGELVILVGCGVVGMVIGATLAYDAGRDDGYKAGNKAAGANLRELDALKKQNESYRKYVETMSAALSNSKTEEDLEEEEGLNDWDSQDTQNWEDICELASKLELKAGESYTIAANEEGEAEDGIPIGDNSVFHYRWGDECYPADAEWYMDHYSEDNEDEEEEEEEEEETNSIFEGKATFLIDADDDEALELVRDLYNLKKEGRISFQSIK